MELELWKLDALEAARELHKSGNHGTASFFEWFAGQKEGVEQWIDFGTETETKSQVNP